MRTRFCFVLLTVLILSLSRFFLSLGSSGDLSGGSLSGPLLAEAQPVVVPTNPTAPAPLQATEQLKVRNTIYGSILTDTIGRALYLFQGDTSPNASLCSGSCSSIWIPFSLQGGQGSPLPMAPQNVPQSLVNGFTRTDGLYQITYNGHPLYYYYADYGSTTTTNGEGLNQFGYFWYLVSPSGTALTLPTVPTA